MATELQKLARKRNFDILRLKGIKAQLTNLEQELRGRVELANSEVMEDLELTVYSNYHKEKARILKAKEAKNG